MVADAELQRRVAERLAGHPVTVSAADSARRAVVQALVERPRVVLCSERTLGARAETLWKELERKGFGGTSFVCVGDPAGTATAPPAGGYLRCGDADLFLLLAALLPALGPRRQRVHVELLASMERMGLHEGRSQAPSFANVLEIGPRDLVFDAPMPLERGQRVALSFFAPDGPGGGQERISLCAEVGAAIDEMRLQYEARIDFADEASRRRILALLHASGKEED